MDLGINQRIALVCGGDSGMGKETARQLLEAGVRVAITDLPDGTLDQALVELSGLGEIIAIEGDVTREQDVTAIWAQVREQLGEPDIYINAAGVTGRRKHGKARVPVSACFRRRSHCAPLARPGSRSAWDGAVGIHNQRAGRIGPGRRHRGNNGPERLVLRARCVQRRQPASAQAGRLAGASSAPVAPAHTRFPRPGAGVPA